MVCHMPPLYLVMCFHSSSNAHHSPLLHVSLLSFTFFFNTGSKRRASGNGHPPLWSGHSLTVFCLSWLLDHINRPALPCWIGTNSGLSEHIQMNESCHLYIDPCGKSRFELQPSDCMNEKPSSKQTNVRSLPKSCSEQCLIRRARDWHSWEAPPGNLCYSYLSPWRASCAFFPKKLHAAVTEKKCWFRTASRFFSHQYRMAIKSLRNFKL